VRDADGSTHTVSFSSAQPDEQVIVVVDPGRLALDLDRHSLAAVPGTTASLAVTVARGKGLHGPVKVELVAPRHMRGVHADPVEIAAGRNQAVLRVHFGPGVPGPFNTPVAIRATVLERGEPVIAEGKVTIEAETVGPR
jgi:hypothetical protein